MASPGRDAEEKRPYFAEHLEVIERLGGGAYGQVYKCKDTRTGHEVAVKWIRRFAEEPISGKRTLREIRLLRSLDHENLLRLQDVLVPAPHEDVCIVMPYLDLDLHRVISSKMKLSESHVQAFLCQILRGVKYLHSAGVVHRDLKPMNVLVNKDCTLRIADFGLARGRKDEEEELSTYVVTRWYRAPELMLLEVYFEAIDLWAVGCIFAELVRRKPLFPGRDHCDMLRRIGNALGFDTQLAWVSSEKRSHVRALLDELQISATPLPEAALERQLPPPGGTVSAETCDSRLDLLNQFLTFDPKRRIAASDALAHPYLLHLKDPAGETVAPCPFPWDFDHFEATPRALMARVHAECASLHPEMRAASCPKGCLPRNRESPR